ncbi:N-acetylglucosamine-6-phosphate deacetylase [Paenibacillus daejeonensis]|uniref:N-acetylglucosamine-6-phosphate deacetylase n=1 Tax=Paenibacillus daejeonensis TaxID=135193 RepID=UPI00036F699F|nr:N-acetylglucosamine-6-phosphate deacetylase [Paenibacillus daejeonensis]
MTRPYTWSIHNVHLVLEDEIVHGTVHCVDGLIQMNRTEAEALPASDSPMSIDGERGYLLPGFIDMHVHGGYGSDFMDANSDAYDAISRFHAGHGTTGMLATTMTAPHSDIEAVLSSVASYQARTMPYAQLLGVHLEGPFISPSWPGAQNPDYIVSPQMNWLKQWESQFPGLIRQLTLAPESDAADEMIAWLSAQGIIAAAGHTDASYEQIIHAVSQGLTQAVHTYNAMTPLHHRKPGTVGAVLTEDAICAELIADGHHVHPAAIRLLVRAKPAEQLVLITDAMSAAGLGNGSYELGGLGVDVQDGVARLQEGGSLAGSTLTMIEAVRFMRKHTELTLPEVTKLASLNPARRLGLDRHTGSIADGKQADLVWCDEQLNVRQTWIKGRSVI